MPTYIESGKNYSVQNRQRLLIQVGDKYYRAAKFRINQAKDVIVFVYSMPSKKGWHVHLTKHEDNSYSTVIKDRSQKVKERHKLGQLDSGFRSFYIMDSTTPEVVGTNMPGKLSETKKRTKDLILNNQDKRDLAIGFDMDKLIMHVYFVTKKLKAKLLKALPKK